MKRTYRTELPGHAPDEVFRWHERPGALERLTPPWGDVKVVRREGGIRDGGEVELEIGFGLFRRVTQPLKQISNEDEVEPAPEPESPKQEQEPEQKINNLQKFIAAICR